MSDVTDVYEFSEDPSNAEQPPLLPDGEYRADVTGCKIDTSKSSGNKMLVVTYRIGSSEYPATFPGPDEGVGQTGYIVMKDDPGGRFNYRKACETHGVVPKAKVDPNDFMGQQVMVRVKSSRGPDGTFRYDPANATRSA